MVEIQALDDNGNASVQTITVTVTDADEVAPAITGGATAATSIVENTTAVANLSANEAVTWSVRGGADSALFAIDPATGALRFVSTPNFEAPGDNGANNTYVVEIQALDANGNASVQTITVMVTDADEVAPAITGGATAAIPVVENTSAVTTLSANGAVTWSVKGGVDSALFAIDPATGALRFLSTPNFEVPGDSDANNIYVVEVQAVDASGNSTVQSITVTVTDADELAPAITGGASVAIPVVENTTAVTTLTANEAVTWSVKGGVDSGLFAIDPATGALHFVSTPNFEAPGDNGANNTYVVEVQALDANGNASIQTITVTVNDVAELPPTTTGGATVAISVAENTTAVTTLTANEAVTWSVKGGADSALFVIDPATGALRFLSMPNFEAPSDNGADNSYVVEVQALDASGNASVRTITVTVTDADEVAPAITGSATAAIPVVENTTAVTTLSANEAVTWSVKGGVDSALFVIDPATGALRFASTPNFEAPGDNGANNSYVVEVQALDAGGNASVQTITVTVTDADEVAPAITGPGGSAGATSASITLGENDSVVTTMGASEAVTWSIGGGADAGRFVINPATGLLSFIGAPDFEAPRDSGADNSYVVEIIATDRSGNPSRQTLTVNVADVDDTAPAAPSLDLLAVSDSGSSSSDNLTNATTPLIRVALNGSGANANVVGETVTLFERGAVVGSVTLTAQHISAGFVDLASVALAAGDKLFTASVTDAAGNVSATSAALALTIDTEAPATPTVKPTLAFDTTPTVSGTAPRAAGEVLTVTVNGVTYTEGDGALTRSGESWTLTIPDANSLPLGSHSVTVTLTDGAGNSRSDSSRNELVVAAVPPPRVGTQVNAPDAPLPVQPNFLPPRDVAAPAGPFMFHVPELMALEDLIKQSSPLIPDFNLTDFAQRRIGEAATFEGILTMGGDDAFQVLVIPVGSPALTLHRGVQDQTFELTKDTRISFRVPSDAFKHTDAKATVKLVATLRNGDPLPNWLVFDPTTGRFEGVVPAGLTGEIAVTIKAVDMEGRSAETIFRIKIVGNKLVGRAGLAEQIRLASKPAPGLIPSMRKA
ncbi:hypothetical protein C7C56_026545 [Massilia glaciei]|uniref:Cadherin domain-containing protein n=1 Tax=Massilia glaciei TaxID=1524097 RepID=A0A2U2HAX4_9BURK|nr:hypothetical protein C7C56_026545 [Massilia glaciei]